MLSELDSVSLETGKFELFSKMKKKRKLVLLKHAHAVYRAFFFSS